MFNFTLEKNLKNKTVEFLAKNIFSENETVNHANTLKAVSYTHLITLLFSSRVKSKCHLNSAAVK